jgi:hypothetical protein
MMAQIILIVSGVFFIGFVIAAIIAFKQLHASKKPIIRQVIDQNHLVYNIHPKFYNFDIHEVPTIFHIDNGTVEHRSLACAKEQNTLEAESKPIGRTRNYQLEYA